MKIQIKDYVKKIGSYIVLDHINLQLEGGVVYGIQGKNGSGKTMLMRAICGFIRPTSGGIFINGAKLGEKFDFPSDTGILIEHPSFIPHYTGARNLQMLADIKGDLKKEDIKQIMGKLGLDHKDKKVYKKYSLGMKQRLGLACAFMGNPSMIMLDEPLNALDEGGIEEVKKMIAEEKEKNTLIMLACHDKEELEILADEIYEINDGKIVSHRIV